MSISTIARTCSTESAARVSERGVVFCEEPREERYGTVAVFEDLYGNRWDLLQPT